MQITVRPFAEYWCVTTSDAVVTFAELQNALTYSLSTVSPGTARVIRIFDEAAQAPYEIHFQKFVCKPEPAAAAPRRRASARGTGARAKWPSRSISSK